MNIFLKTYFYKILIKLSKILVVMLYKLLFLILIIIILFIFYKSVKIEKFENKPYIWMYWETPQNKIKPGYIDLCYNSVLHNCSDCFNIILLDEKNIYQYIPNLDDYKLDHLAIPQKVDLYRYILLEKYGGLWIDADILVLKCLCGYYKKLDKYDYVGFGCGFDKKTCGEINNGYGRPLNWMMASKPNTPYLKCIKDSALEKINTQGKINYHGIGKDVLKQCHDHLKESKNWDYYHVNSKCNEYDSEGNKLNNIFKKFNNNDCSDRYFFPFYNTAPGLPQWFKELSIDELKDLNINTKPIIKEAFQVKSKCNL